MSLQHVLPITGSVDGHVEAVNGASHRTLRASLVIATYRSRLDYLSVAVRSALAQSESDIEVIVTDDSPDCGVKRFVDTIVDSRLRYRRNEVSLGPAQNHWAAFREARGRYVAVLNHDDWIAPTFVERLAIVLDAQSGAVLAFCDHWVIDEQGRCLVKASLRNS